MRETAHLAHTIRNLHRKNQNAVLATVVRVTGSAYRRQGAKLVIDPKGNFEGMISGGCLEPEVAQMATQVFQTGKAISKIFDLTENSVWGLGLGCSGTVQILLERVGQDPVWDRWLETLSKGEKSVRVVVFESARSMEFLGLWLLLAAEEAPSGFLTQEDWGEEAIQVTQEVMRQALPQSQIVTLHETEFFLDINLPPLELIIFGAGQDTIPLSRLALNLGFSVTVVDPRTAFTQPNRFPGAQTIVSHPTDYKKNVKISPNAYALVMNHKVDLDRAGLRYALQCGAVYVGLLGPRNRFENLRSSLSSEGFPIDVQIENCVRSPVGLDIGAEGPDQIAISILGEILAIHNGFSGGFLSKRSGGIHVRQK